MKQYNNFNLYVYIVVVLPYGDIEIEARKMVITFNYKGKKKTSIRIRSCHKARDEWENVRHFPYLLTFIHILVLKYLSENYSSWQLKI